jgi:putative hemin transport protein
VHRISLHRQTAVFSRLLEIVRERDLAGQLGISEAELVAADVGAGTVRLTCDVPAVLNGLAEVGEVMALTRNESVVHEKIGTYGGVRLGEGAGVVIGDEINLRVFPPRWKHAFAVEKVTADGQTRRSLQFFDRAGDAVHKVYLRLASDLARYRALVTQLASPDQEASLPEVAPILPVARNDAVSREELNASWSRLTDTHDFYPMRRLKLPRIDAVAMAEDTFTWPLDLDATPRLIDVAVAEALPIMVFAGSRGCVQIHAGTIRNVKPMGPWLNILDENFHMHLRLDHIADLWAVRKPTDRGQVTSVEAYDANGSLIVQFFGIQEKGLDAPRWPARSRPRLPSPPTTRWRELKPGPVSTSPPAPARGRACRLRRSA